MTQSQTMIDRLRIERAVWTLDARLQDLPQKSRVAKRRELRQNLRAAAAEIGARQAVRQLGDLRVVAADYLAAEYGDVGRRPSWTAAAIWIAAVDLVMMLIDHVTSSAFRAGVTAARDHPTGTFHWDGVPLLTHDGAVTYVGGSYSSVGGSWTVWVYLLMFGGAVLAGRLWRLVPALRGRSFARSALPD